MDNSGYVDTSASQHEQTPVDAETLTSEEVRELIAEVRRRCLTAAAEAEDEIRSSALSCVDGRN